MLGRAHELRSDGAGRGRLNGACRCAFMKLMKAWVYMLASKRNGTLYVGVTRDMHRRLIEHLEELMPGFTSRYGVKTLVWFEAHDSIAAAIYREKRLKKYKRAWKINLIEAMNPEWRDLRGELMWE